MAELKHFQELIESSIRFYSAKWENTHPVNLYRPVAYSLNVGGKRLRPLLVLLAYQLFDDKYKEAVPAAMAVEVFHNFTLLHDDIMDKAEIRRNKPAVHVRFNENSAILSGDVMAFLAYNLLLECRSEHLAEIVSLFSRTAKEICEGQQLDMDFESRLDVTTDEYIEMIRLKTAVLLGCSLQIGGRLGGCDENCGQILYDAGIHLGLAFQLQDDLLDTFGDEFAFGKKIGGDIESDKKTFLLIKALQLSGTSQKNELLNWLKPVQRNSDSKIPAVKAIFENLGIREITGEKIKMYSHSGIKLLEMLPAANDRKVLLINLFRNLIDRIS
jgi:geranylgeranyl diphosphate synthase, type II